THDEPCSMAPDDKHDLISGTCSHLPKDYGGPFQFALGIGLGYAITKNWLIGYQYEHMSNAYMYDKNPGLDSHTLHIEYRF
ncbi:acyloxyacyl hydrolase, partial [Aeromonas veronii]